MGTQAKYPHCHQRQRGDCGQHKPLKSAGNWFDSSRWQCLNQDEDDKDVQVLKNIPQPRLSPCQSRRDHYTETMSKSTLPLAPLSQHSLGANPSLRELNDWVLHRCHTLGLSCIKRVEFHFPPLAPGAERTVHYAFRLYLDEMSAIDTWVAGIEPPICHDRTEILEGLIDNQLMRVASAIEFSTGGFDWRPNELIEEDR